MSHLLSAVKDAVETPCCHKNGCMQCKLLVIGEGQFNHVSLGVREHLMGHNLSCPFCSTTNVSPDSLLPAKAVRSVLVCRLY